MRSGGGRVGAVGAVSTVGNVELKIRRYEEKVAQV